MLCLLSKGTAGAVSLGSDLNHNSPPAESCVGKLTNGLCLGAWVREVASWPQGQVMRPEPGVVLEMEQ